MSQALYTRHEVLTIVREVLIRYSRPDNPSAGSVNQAAIPMIVEKVGETLDAKQMPAGV